MSFARAKIKRFNEVTFCSPPVGSYTPKFDGTFPYPGTKSSPIRRPSRAGSVVSLRSHGSNTRPSSRSSAGSSNSEDGRTKWPEGKGCCKAIPPSDERSVGEGKTEADKVIDVKVSDVKVSNVQVSDSDALEVKGTAEHGIASTELINSLRSEISEKCITVEKLTLKVEELLADNRRKTDELEKLVKENQSRTEETEAVKFQLEKLRSEHSKTVEELERTKMVVKRLRQENRRKTTELSNAKAALEKIPKSGSPTSIPEAKKSRLSQERLQNKSFRLTAQLQRSRVLLRLADACQNRRKSAENYSESKNNLKQEEGKSLTKIKPKDDLNPNMVQQSSNKEEELAKVHGTVAQGYIKHSVDANRCSVINAIVATKTEAKTETRSRQDFTRANTDETPLRRQSSCVVSNAEDGGPSLSTETPEDWKIELEELRKQLDDVDPCMEEQMETWLKGNDSIDDRKEELPMDRLKLDQVEPRCGHSFRTFPAKITESSAVGRSFERDLTKLHAIERDLNRIRDKTRSEDLGTDRTPPEIDSCDKRSGQKKRNSTLLSQKMTSLKAVYGREMNMETKTYRVDDNTNSMARERTERARNTSVLSLSSREFPREKVSACNKRRVDDQSPTPTGDSSKDLSQATKTQSGAETVRSYEDFLIRSGRSHRLGTNDLKTRASARWRPSVTKTDGESEKSFQTKDSEKDLSIVDGNDDDDDDPDSPSRWKKRYEELWTTAQPFRDLLSAFSAQKQMLSDRRRRTKEEDNCVDRLCGEFSKIISHEHEKRRMRQVVELKKQNSLLRIELEAIRRRRSAPPIIANRSGQQQQQQQPPQ